MRRKRTYFPVGSAALFAPPAAWAHPDVSLETKRVFRFRAGNPAGAEAEAAAAAAGATAAACPDVLDYRGRTGIADIAVATAVAAAAASAAAVAAAAAAAAAVAAAEASAI